MALNLYLNGILAIVVGLLILVFPGLLRIAVGTYLVLIGILSFFNF